MYKKLPETQNTFFILPVLVFLCSLFSIFLVYNASSIYAYNNFGNSYYFLINQSIWFGVSFIIFFIIQKIKLSFIEKNITLFYFISIFFLILVLLPTPFSLNVYGARRWLILNPQGILPEFPFLGRLTIQPSEVFKLSVCLFFPKMLLQNIRLGEKELVIKSLIYTFLPALLILFEPDLKDTIIIILIAVSIMFVTNVSLKYFLPAIPLLLVAGLVLVLVAPYRFERLKTYMGGGNDLGTSYHIKQINIALGSGGLFGVGIGKSIQKNEYLPEVMGDSIFAVFAEEFGFIGSASLIGLILFILFIIYKITLNFGNIYYKLFSTGILTWISAQSIMNLGSISGILPLTGVPLPLISYGGSSLLFSIIGLSLLYRFYKQDIKRV